MDKYDINQELKSIDIEASTFEIQNSNHVGNFEVNFKYFHHSHRLGARVPLFILLDSSHKCLEYFCKIGNVLGVESLHFNVSLFIQLIRKYGSIFGVVISFGQSAADFVAYLLLISSLAQSEIRAVVMLNVGHFPHFPDEIVKFSDNADTLNFQTAAADVNLVEFSRVPEVMNARILEKLQIVLKEPCVEWLWQYEQSDKILMSNQLVFKNLEKWRETCPAGNLIPGCNIIPMKLMRDNDPDHSPELVFQKFSNVGLIIDLSNDEGSYDKTIFSKNDVEYKKIELGSKTVPSSMDIFQFISIIQTFRRRHSDKLIFVHCHYGYNRTGLMVCAYLIENNSLSVPKALEIFREARPPGIKHQNYIDKLYIRYADTI